MMRRFWPLVLAPLLIAATCACQPTGVPRCDKLVEAFTARAVIEDHGYRLDCDPGFSSWNGTRYVSAWTDRERMTVWIWPDRITVFANAGSKDAQLVHNLWHEAAHTTGISRECVADEWAYKHMKPREREGIGFLEC
jgi:hypothetical protein